MNWDSPLHKGNRFLLVEGILLYCDTCEGEHRVRAVLEAGKLYRDQGDLCLSVSAFLYCDKCGTRFDCERFVGSTFEIIK